MKTTLAAATPSLFAQQQRIGPPAHTKGPKVYLDYDQVELDSVYDQASYAPNMRQITERWASNSEIFRTRWGVPARFSYGTGSSEKLDVYR